MEPNFSSSVAFPVLIALYVLLLILLVFLSVIVTQLHKDDFVKILDFGPALFRGNISKYEKLKARGASFASDPSKADLILKTKRNSDIKTIWIPTVLAALVLLAVGIWFGVIMSQSGEQQSQPIWIFGLVSSLVILIALAATTGSSRCIKTNILQECGSKPTRARDAVTAVSFIVLFAILGVSIAGVVLTSTQ